MRLSIAAPLALAACSGPSANQPAPPATAVAATPAPASDTVVPPANPARPDADYVGRWIGVEGMYLVVARRDGGGVDMAMQYDLDHEGRYRGTVTPEGLRFERDGVGEVARPSDGDATGLKYLAGKKDCLTVKSGEGYCRD